MPEQQNKAMYYGFRCYNPEGTAIGWLYTANAEKEYNWTDKPQCFDWCKRWKTEKGAKKNFDWYNKQWQFKSKGGYLKIEQMPEEIESPRQSQEKWDKANPDVIKESKAKYDYKRPTWSFRPTPENLEWLEQERWDDDQGKPETDAALLNRKLSKLRELEQQGF